MRSANVGGWIDGSTMFENFEVNMRAGGPSSASHESNNIASAHKISNLYIIFFIVSIPCAEPITMGDLNHLPITRSVATPTDYTARNSENFSSFLSCEIHPIMPSTLARNWVNSISVRR